MFGTLINSLKHDRKATTKKISGAIIFGIIILVFIFWGIGRNQMSAGDAAATVNDARISVNDYLETVDRLNRDPRYQQIQSLGGDAGRQMIARQALSQLVEMELLKQAIEKEHIWTSDAEVRDVIVSIPQFQEEGRFKRDLYRNYVAAVRKTEPQFEDDIRREQSIRRTVQLFGAAMRPLKLETEKEKSLQAMKANIEFASVPTENLVAAESISKADIAAFMKDPSSDGKVKDYYNSHKADFSTPERVKVRHILIRAKAGDAEAERKALAKIEDLAKRAKKEDFAKLAGEASEDPGSKSKGGLIDYFSRGKMVPEFEEAAFSQPVNEIGKPVKTEYGYHLIQVLDKKPAQNRTFEDVRDEIASILIAKDRSKLALEQLQGYLQKGDTNAVSKFMTEHKLKWDETGPFSIQNDSVPKIGPNEEIVRTAFRLTPEKPLADSLVREGGRAFVVRYKAVGAQKDDKKDETPDLLAEMKSSRRGDEAVRKWLDDLRATSKISLNPSVLARAGGGGSSED